jgi:hypothetical protein
MAVTFLKILEDGHVYNSSVSSIQRVVLELKKAQMKNPDLSLDELSEAVCKTLKVKKPVSVTSDDVNRAAAVAYYNDRFVAFLPSGDGANTPLKPLYFVVTGVDAKGKKTYAFKRVHQRKKANAWVRPGCNAVRNLFDRDSGSFVGGDRKAPITVHGSSSGSTSWGMQSAAIDGASDFDWE